VATIAISVVSTFLLVIYIPLALLRWWARRDRMSFILVAVLSAGALIQASALIFDLTNRDFVSPRYNPVWALQSFVWWAVPHSMLGWRSAHSLDDNMHWNQLGLVALAWVIIIAALVLALRKVTQPKWLLAIVAGAHCVGLACMTIMSNGMITQRYLLPVEMLLFTALVALLIPADGPSRLRAQVPLVALACIVMVVSAFNYRHDQTWRHQGPLWTEQMKLAYASCQEHGRREVVVRSAAAPWYSLVRVPCHVFRTQRWCEPPFCAEIGVLQLPAALPQDRKS
jgi:hypothetical protein